MANFFLKSKQNLACKLKTLCLAVIIIIITFQIYFDKVDLKKRATQHTGINHAQLPWCNYLVKTLPLKEISLGTEGALSSEHLCVSANQLREKRVNPGKAIHSLGNSPSLSCLFSLFK